MSVRCAIPVNWLERVWYRPSVASFKGMLNCLANSATSLVSCAKPPPICGAMVWTSAIRRWNSMDCSTASRRASRIWLMARTISCVITTRESVPQVTTNLLVLSSASAIPAAPVVPASLILPPVSVAVVPTVFKASLSRWVSASMPGGSQNPVRRPGGLRGGKRRAARPGHGIGHLAGGRGHRLHLRDCAVGLAVPVVQRRTEGRKGRAGRLQRIIQALKRAQGVFDTQAEFIDDFVGHAITRQNSL